VTETIVEPETTVRAAVSMGAITAVSRAVGFVRVLVVAAVLGTTYLGNAFQSANSLSNVVFELVAAGALSAVLVPAFVDLLDVGDERGAEEVAGGVLGIALAGLGLIAVIGVVAAPWLARLLTLGVPAEVAVEQRELVTFLLRFFVPQIVLYAAGTVAIGVLYAKRRFWATAAAPIGNTVVMVACLVAFRVVAGDDPGLDLSAGSQALLVVAGTGGVFAFVATLLSVCWKSGFRLRPRWPAGDRRVGRVLRQAGWGVMVHTSAGVLLGGAVLAGAAVPGGVVAYQVAWVFFLAPYGIFAQPVHTAILPELVAEARQADLSRFRMSVRWSLERMAIPVLPIAALLAALSVPAMRAVSFGQAQSGDGPHLLAVAVATLALGLFPYGAFLLLARAYYALGDSRTPGVVALGAAGVGAAVMAVGAPLTQGAARIAVLGLAHTAAQVVALAVLARGLARRCGGTVVPAVVGFVAVVSVVVGGATLATSRFLLQDPASRTADLLTTAGLGTVAALTVVAVFVAIGLRGRLTTRPPVDGRHGAIA